MSTNRNFKPFAVALSNQLKHFDFISKKFTGSTIFLRSSLTAEQLWETYINSFTEEENPIFRTKREYDCRCCKNFIRDVGGLLLLSDGRLTSIWECQIDDPVFMRVAENMTRKIHESGIGGIFLHSEPTIGHQKTIEQSGLVWDHFFGDLPALAYAHSNEIGTNEVSLILPLWY